ncbi:MAG: SDR family oxidoreductase [Bacteriovorax sp.]|nr:SDR family oxidoreductase [Bacteriovorax sp.]
MEKRIALVTGANRGIGKEVVKQLAELGYIVFLGSRDLEKGEEAVKKLIPQDNIFCIALDVTNEESINKAKNIIENKFGQLDVLVNNAGILYDSWHDVSNADLKTVREAMDTNTYGPLRVTQAMLPLLLKSTRGRIVNVSSEAGSLASMKAAPPAYNLSKVALNGLTRMFADLLRPKDILVNSVCPGWTHTDMGGGGRPIPEGAKSVVWAVTIHDDGPTGGFFRDGKKLEW